ncbi:hypothetical protein NDU88_005362 [Pleurodeles waltl]|uniref:Uncharacterized protein n=1 Tax=Pleurodeles waltl TaxID=8319 RepID=A0AAV7QFG0_PLEWA|nr:hypothetical protein NDU88_005362 [Pleurodeles waltl]
MYYRSARLHSSTDSLAGYYTSTFASLTVPYVQTLVVEVGPLFGTVFTLWSLTLKHLHMLELLELQPRIEPGPTRTECRVGLVCWSALREQAGGRHALNSHWARQGPSPPRCRSPLQKGIRHTSTRAGQRWVGSHVYRRAVHSSGSRHGVSPQVRPLLHATQGSAAPAPQSDCGPAFCDQQFTTSRKSPWGEGTHRIPRDPAPPLIQLSLIANVAGPSVMGTMQLTGHTAIITRHRSSRVLPR